MIKSYGNLKNNKGQTIYYFVILCLLLIISWAMMLNIAQIIIQRMQIQNRADNVALSIATDRARTMNIVAGLNYLIGIAIVFGNYPLVVQTPTYNVGYVGAYYGGDMDSSFGTKDAAAKRLKSLIETFQTIQNGAILGHSLYIAAQYASLISDGFVPVITPIVTSASDLGLKRNSKKATFIKTRNVKLVGVHGVYPGGTAATLKETWYISTKDIYKQKVKVILTKMGGGYPWALGSLVGVSKPTIIAYSAAAIYNTKGTMFPSEESSVVGMPNWEIALVAEGLYAASMAQFVKSIVKFFPGPLEPIGYAIAAALLTPSVGFHAYSLVMAIGLDDKKNPMKSYTNAKEKGWAAHLVPFLNSSGK